MGHHQRWDLQGLDDIGHGEGLARAGGAKQDLVTAAFFDAINNFGNGLGLVTCGLIGSLQFEGHGLIIVQPGLFQSA